MIGFFIHLDIKGNQACAEHTRTLKRFQNTGEGIYMQKTSTSAWRLEDNRTLTSKTREGLCL